MDFLSELWTVCLALADFILHVDVHLTAIVAEYRAWTYLVLFAIVFCETGLVVTPFLPGDSLLFAAGAVAAKPGTGLDTGIIMLVLIAAAVLGDTVNYTTGALIGPKVFDRPGRFIRREHLLRTRAFYERHGGKTIILARFVPIIRTFAPFVAGVGTMHYRRFLAYNVIGGGLWVLLFVGAGHFFGNLPAVRENFTLVIFAIVFISCLPPVVEYVRIRRGEGAGRPPPGSREPPIADTHRNPSAPR